MLKGKNSNADNVVFLKYSILRHRWVLQDQHEQDAQYGNFLFHIHFKRWCKIRHNEQKIKGWQ